ncbi:alpha-E domain-containing protein [Haloferula sp.]|uniref:alpha-E domain-containing protein n=1 Tax=Haloferula sp. TaxID=2497595 RepID=UPI003C708F2E
MLCRVADSLFWMSRYIERAENTVRLVDVTHQTLLESEHSSEEVAFKNWIPTLETLGDLARYNELYEERSSRTVTEFLTFSSSNSSSVYSCIASARENARMIRDQISTEMWEALNKLYLFVKRADADTICRESDFAFFEKVKDFSHLFRGIIESTFPHDLGYDYVVCGREIERAIKTCQILGTKQFMPSMVDSPDDALDAAQYAAILRSSTGFEAFHHEHGSDLDSLPVRQFLLLSRIFPRSALYCIQRLQLAMHRISGCPTTYYSNEAERLTGKLVANLNYAVASDLNGVKGDSLIREIQVDLEEIATAFSLQYMGVAIYDPVAKAVAV